MIHTEMTLLILFAVATGVAVAARWLKLPYTVALVITGLVLGGVHIIDPPHLTQEVLYGVFLPGLLFEAAFHLEFGNFWKNKKAIFSLAIPGLLVAIGLTAAILTPAAAALTSGFLFIHALVFAALIAATDPIAVVGLFKSLGAPKRLGVLVEGESLLNDGAAVVIFALILGVAAGGEFSLGSAILDFVRVAGMGLLIGGVIGYAVASVMTRIDDPMVEITLTVIAAYGSFLAAEHFHFSGVIATVTAGMLCGNYATNVGMSPTTRVSVETFWEYLAFALNSLVFLLIGFEVQLDALVESWAAIGLAYLAVMAARAVVIFAVSAALKKTRETMPWAWSLVLTWSGLRGALSMVLVLGLVADFPHRDLLVHMTFGVVLLSILGQGLTMSPLLRKLGVGGVHGERLAYQKERGTLRAAKAALRAVAAMRKEQAIPEAILDDLASRYDKRIEAAEAVIEGLHLELEILRDEAHRAAERQLLIVEKDALADAVRAGDIGTEAAEELGAEVDRRLTELEGH